MNQTGDNNQLDRRRNLWNRTPGWLRGISIVLIVLGCMTVVRYAVSGHKHYQVRISVGDYGDAHQPPIYLVERRWWGLTALEYPLRYSPVDGWAYERDGQWHEVLWTPIAEDVAVRELGERPGKDE